MILIADYEEDINRFFTKKKLKRVLSKVEE